MRAPSATSSCAAARRSSRLAILRPSSTSASGRLGVITVASGTSRFRSSATASSRRSLAPPLATITGSTTTLWMPRSEMASATAAMIAAVAEAISDLGIHNVVVDPVMVAKGGAKLLRDDAVAELRKRLVPLATVITPNLPEAEVLLGRKIASLDDRRAAAHELVALGARIAVVKGGHADGDAIDVFFDGTQTVELRAGRVPTRNTHGSGCVFSAAITAGLARGLAPLAAVHEAKDFITLAIAHSLEIGHGHGPVNPMFALRTEG